MQAYRAQPHAKIPVVSCESDMKATSPVMELAILASGSSPIASPPLSESRPSTVAWTELGTDTAMAMEPTSEKTLTDL